MGVVPRLGLDHIAVGRVTEITALQNDLEHVADGGGAFRLIVGRYGSGKSFLGQLLRTHALDQNFVVSHADFSPTRRLTGSQGQGVDLYREITSNLAIATTDTNALNTILQRWIGQVQNRVVEKYNIEFNSPQFATAVKQEIRVLIDNMEGMVHSFDYANVISAYWEAYLKDDEQRQNAALRWLRGEFNVKTESRQALGVREIVNDLTWYNYLKLLARFVKEVGYSGLIVFLDEAVNLYKISNTTARQNNYERLLTILNDTMQGGAQYLGVVISGTPEFLTDDRKGLYSYDALRTRLQRSRFETEDLVDYNSAVISLQMLNDEQIMELLRKVHSIYETHHKMTIPVTEGDTRAFLERLNTLGASEFLTPRDVLREFVTVLNLCEQNRDKTFASIVTASDYEPEIRRASTDYDSVDDRYVDL